MLELFPINSRLKNVKPVIYLYNINHSYDDNMNYDPHDAFSLIWSCTLSDTVFPSAALISRNNYVITFEYNFIDHERTNIINLYSDEGKFIHRINLNKLIEKDVLNKFSLYKDYLINWCDNIRYYLTCPNFEKGTQSWWDPTHLYIFFDSNNVVDISLTDGETKYGNLKSFTHLDSLKSQQIVNAEDYIRRIDLLFSSVTEILSCSK